MYVICSEELGLLFTWHRDSATLLAWNLVGMCCIAGWAAANGLLIFYTLDKLGMLRVAPDMEFRGKWSLVGLLSTSHHGEIPDFKLKFWRLRRNGHS